MSIRYCLKRKNYKVSKRNFLCDYSKIKPKKIDMTLSGKYIGKYPKIKVSLKGLDKYPLLDDTKKLENLIKRQIKTECEIIIGNGSNGLLQNIIKILFQKKGNLVTPYYTFNQAEFGVTSYGSVTRRVFMKNFNIDFDKIKKSISNKTRLVYICNPNNPTGLYIDSKKLIEFCMTTDKYVVIDESGIEFTNEEGILDMNLLNENGFLDNLLVIRSFSKGFGLANLRIGYLACSKQFKKRYIENVTNNEYSGISCSIVSQILDSNLELVHKNIKKIIAEREKIRKSLNEIGIEVLPSCSNIIFTKTAFNKGILEFFDKNDISVVPVLDEGKNIHIRIAVQDVLTNDSFINIMRNSNLEKYIINNERKG